MAKRKLEMEQQKEKEPVMAASEEVSQQFKTLVDAQDLDSLKQMQHLMYSLSLSLSRLYNLTLVLYSSDLS